MIHVIATITAPSLEINAVEVLEQSIERTQKNLETQKKIKDLLVELNSLKKRFVKNETSKEEAWRMVKVSANVLKLIENDHLEHLFSVEFLEELKVFSTYATKTSVGLKQ
jgi:ribosomal protein L28